MKTIENIRKNIEDFKVDTLKLDAFLTGTRISYQFFKDNYPDIKKEFSNQSRNENEIKGMREFDNLNDSISVYENEILKYCFINIIARTDAFLNDIAHTIYKWKKPDLQKEEIDKVILKYSHSSFKSKLIHLNNEFGLLFPHIEENETSISELFSRRNIILHNNCLVNETYLKINQNSTLKVGEEIIVNEDYLKFTIISAIIIAKSIEDIIINNELNYAKNDSTKSK